MYSIVKIIKTIFVLNILETKEQGCRIFTFSVLTLLFLYSFIALVMVSPLLRMFITTSNVKKLKINSKINPEMEPNRTHFDQNQESLFMCRQSS